MSQPSVSQRIAKQPDGPDRTVDVKCSECGESIQVWETRCSACEESAGFPNVRAARVPAEDQALRVRRASALETLETRGALDVGLAFETAVATDSRAVINRTLSNFMGVVQNETGSFSNFYQLAGIGLRNPFSDSLNELRPFVDQALFPGYHESIHFAALSLDDKGLSSYGGCSIVLRNSMVESRASVFDRNTLIWMLQQNLRLTELARLPAGHRANWDRRGTLALVKCASWLTASTSATSYSKILLSNGQDNVGAKFVEVHIWGRLTLKAVERVLISVDVEDVDKKLYLRALREKLTILGISITDGCT